MVDFSVHAQGFGKVHGPNRHDHEFLDINVVIGMGTAIKDIHHRNRQFLGVDTAQVLVQGKAGVFGGCLGAGKADAQDGIGTKFAFIFGSIKAQERLVNLDLTRRFKANEGIADDVVDVIHSLQDAFTEVTVLIPVTQFHGFMNTCGSTARNSSAADDAVIKEDFHFNGGVAAGIQDFSCTDIFNKSHCYAPLLFAGISQDFYKQAVSCHGFRFFKAHEGKEGRRDVRQSAIHDGRSRLGSNDQERNRVCRMGRHGHVAYRVLHFFQVAMVCRNADGTAF